jgi:RNA polymerase sigma-70 factor, ECF subfamily
MTLLATIMIHEHHHAYEDAMDNSRISVLLQKCKNNDRMAQHELFHVYKQNVYNMVFKSLGCSFDIDDIVQQIFIALFESLGHYKAIASFDTWVYRICTKMCMTQLRKKYRKHRPAFLSETHGVDVSQSADFETPHSALEEKERNAVIYAALSKLSPDKRMIVILYEMEGKTLEEIAALTKTPLGTIKSRLFHGRKTLEKHLKGSINYDQR